MIRHTVLFGWSDDATDEQKKRVAAEVARLPGLVPSVREFAAGPDAGLAEGNFDFAVTVDFDDTEGFAAYRDNQDHRAIVDQHILPITARRVAVQFQF